MNSASRSFVIAAFLFFLCGACLPEPDGINPSELGKWSYFTKNDGLTDNFVSYIFEDPEGIIWFGHSTGLTRYDGHDFEKYTTDDGLLSNHINCIYYDSAGDLLVGTGNGINYREKGGTEWKYWGLQGTSIYQIIQDHTGAYWFATPNYGLVCYKDQQLFSFYDPSCDDCNYTNDVAESADGIIWVASRAGIQSFDGTAFNLYSTPDYPISGNNVYCIRTDSWGSVWFGGSSVASVTKYSHGAFETINLNLSTDKESVSSMANGLHGDLWIATTYHGLVHYDGVIMRTIYDGTPALKINYLMADSKGNLWVATNDKGVGRYKMP